MRDCIADDPIEHPYSWCIKEAVGEGDTMVDNTVPANPNGFDQTTENIGGMLNYATGLVMQPTQSLRAECGGKVGNKYVLKTGGECMHNGQVVTRHKYVNNMGGKNSGLIPAALGSATRINGIGIMTALSGDTVPECTKVKLKCHVVKKTGADTADKYFGNSSDVYIPNNELEDIRYEDATNIVPNSESFENLYESIAQYLENNKEYFDTMNILNSKVNGDIGAAFNDKTMVKMYYLLLCLLMAYIMFKFIHKK